ncbi:MAG: energy transducer TonB [Gemmatimonadetes bacterium]|nr:energy transducer TonB [Gemmatimonadota bacterium]MCA9761898.1 energy transducer TonB [Gemmatimonadota bacterium]HPF60525.1 energy transducer TonB [Gemmatimonadales bacterium]HRX18963.1 energy transducer TonB [Gemmatimonadales bacterium]
MFENLIESQPKRQRSIGGTATSLILHVVLIFGAVKATQGAAEVVQGIIQDSTSFLIAPPPPPPPPPPETPPPDAIVSANPPPQGFQTLVPPKDLPTEIPPVNLNEKFDAADFSGRGVEGGIATGVVGGTGPVLDNIVTSETFTSDQVDDPVQPLTGPSPVYPETMRAVGIDGTVRLRFVVGTNGRVESGSISVVSSTNKAFEPAAIKAIRDWTFKPAKMRGQAVRQLVEQNIRFSLTG